MERVRKAKGINYWVIGKIIKQVMRYAKKTILDICKRAGVKKVIAANHHGMVFLLSDGPEQRGGIVWRNDDLNNEKMGQIALEINEILEKINLFRQKLIKKKKKKKMN